MNKNTDKDCSKEEMTFQAKIKVTKSNIKNNFAKIINSNLEDTILQFQKQYLKELQAIEYACLCFQYLLSKQKSNSDEVNKYEPLKTKINRIKMNAQKEVKSWEDFENHFQYYIKLLVACKMKLYCLCFDQPQQYDKYSKYFSLLDSNYIQQQELITKKTINPTLSSESIKQKIVELTEQQINDEPFDYVVIEAIFTHIFQEDYLNYKLLLIVFIVVKRNLDCWIQNPNFQKIYCFIVQLLKLLSDPEIVINQKDFPNDKHSMEYKLMNAVTLIKHLIDVSYKISEKLLRQKCYFMGVKMYYFGLKYKMELRDLGMKIEIDRDCQYFILCCQYASEQDELNLQQQQYQYYQAIAYNQLQQYDQSLEIADNLINLSPNQTKYHYIKGIILRDMKKYDESMKEFLFCLSIGLNNYKFICQTARILFAQGRYQDFLMQIDLQLQQNKQYLVTAYLKSLIFILQNNYSQSKQILLQLTNLYPTFLNGYIHLNLIGFKLDLTEQIRNLKYIQLLSSILSLYFNINVEPSQFYNYGLYMMQKEEFQLGTFYLFKSIYTNRFSIYRYFGQNKIYFSDLEFKQYQTNVMMQLSKEYCQETDDLVFMVDSMIVGSHIFYMDKKYLASVMLTKMLDCIKTDQLSATNKKVLIDKVQLNLLICYQKVNIRLDDQYEEFFDVYYISSDSLVKQIIRQESIEQLYCFALLDYDKKLYKLIKFKQNSKKVEIMEGYRLWYEHKFKEAEVYFNQIVSVHYDYIEIHLTLANIQQKLKKWQESIIQLNQAINIDKSNQYSYLQKAYAFRCLNLDDQVIQTYDQGLQYCQRTNKILRCKAQYLYEIKRYREVILMMEKFDKKSLFYRSQLQLEFNYGMSLYQTNDKRVALKIFQSFNRLNDSFRWYIQQGLKFEKISMPIAQQFYLDIQPIFKGQESLYLRQRLQIIQGNHNIK